LRIPTKLCYNRDKETGLYYLQSRYYDPSTGRFINGDMPEFAIISQTALGHNLYAYCENKPISMIDYLGTEAIALSVIASTVATALAKAIGVVLKIIFGLILILGAVFLIIKFIQAINAYIKAMPKRKTLSDTKAKLPKGEVYYLAYITTKGELKKNRKSYEFCFRFGCFRCYGCN